MCKLDPFQPIAGLVKLNLRICARKNDALRQSGRERSSLLLATLPEPFIPSMVGGGYAPGAKTGCVIAIFNDSLDIHLLNQNDPAEPSHTRHNA